MPNGLQVLIRLSRRGRKFVEFIVDTLENIIFCLRSFILFALGNTPNGLAQATQWAVVRWGGGNEHDSTSSEQTHQYKLKEELVGYEGKCHRGQHSEKKGDDVFWRRRTHA